MSTVGLLLAAGAGSRMGRPKALVHDADATSWLVRSVGALVDGGCDRVTVVLGARADEARELVPAGVDIEVADDWATGMSASLRAGLRALAGGGAGDADAALLSLVDLPDVSADVVRRVIAAAAPTTLARAAYDARPGHPVLLGRDHWTAIADCAVGDEGAKHYLAARDVLLVECGDLATGADVDSR